MTTFYAAIEAYDKAIEYFIKTKQLADTVQSLDWMQQASEQLDSVYVKTGNFQQSYYYNGLYHQYKDSLEKLGKEKDMLQVEVADVQQREARLEKERQERVIRNHNIQYMAITIGIAAVFVFLVLLGAFRVSVSTIRVLGFFAFIMLFEFIVLIADSWIHGLTQGEPWKVLAIKIILIAMLLPLHHWAEQKLVSYLTSHKMVMPSGKNWWKKRFGKTKTLVQ